MTNATLRGKPYAGNPHVRFDEGEVASVKPRRGSPLYIKYLTFTMVLVAVSAFAMPATYNDLGNDAGVSNDFWNTTQHAAVAVDRDWGDAPNGYDPRGGEDGVAASGAGFDLRGKVSEESGIIAFISTQLRGLLLLFK